MQEETSSDSGNKIVDFNARISIETWMKVKS